MSIFQTFYSFFNKDIYLIVFIIISFASINSNIFALITFFYKNFTLLVSFNLINFLQQEVGRVVRESYKDETENNPESTFLSDNCHNDNTAENDQLSARSLPVDSALPNVTADIHNSEDENVIISMI